MAHHETTLDQRAIISLAELESVEYLSNSTKNAESFRLEFKDGQSIAFKLDHGQDTENLKNEWVQNIQDSNELLLENRMPSWQIVE